MTRDEFKQKARLRLRQFFGTAVGGDPITLNDFVTEAVGETAQKTDACYGGRKKDLTVGTVTYCQPAFYKVKRVLILNGFGEYKPIKTYRDEREADKEAPGWRQHTLGHPDAAVFQGVNTVELTRTPVETIENGIVLKGYFRPQGKDWPDGDDDSPFVTFIGADDAAMAHLFWSCCRFDPRKEIQQQAQSFYAEWEQKCGELEAVVALHHSRIN